MPSRQELTRNNIRAGVFVTISLLLIVGVIVVLTGVLETLQRSYEPYVVTFP